jgi:hypothetical protein
MGKLNKRSGKKIGEIQIKFLETKAIFLAQIKRLFGTCARSLQLSPQHKNRFLKNFLFIIALLSIFCILLGISAFC